MHGIFIKNIVEVYSNLFFIERFKHTYAKYTLHTIHIDITIFSSEKRLISGFVVTSLSVVADHNMVAKIVMFLSFFTLKGCINFIGIKVRI